MLRRTLRCLVKTRWELEAEWIGSMREPDTSQLDKVFSLERKRIKKTILKGDEDEMINLLYRLEKSLTLLDPKPDENFSELACHFCGWGSWVFHNPRALDDLFSLCETRTFELMKPTCSILSRTVQWIPEKTPDLVERHIVSVANLINRASKHKSPAAVSGFAHGMVLLTMMLKGAGTDNPSLQKISRFPLVKWWRTVVDEHPEFITGGATIFTFNEYLQQVLERFPDKLQMIGIADLNRINKYAKHAEEPDASDVLASHKRIITLMAFSDIVSMKYAVEDYVFLAEAVKKKWIIKFASELRKLKWSNREGMLLHGNTVGSVLKACQAFAQRWPLDVAQAEIPKLAVDKLRMTLGYIQLPQNRSKLEETKTESETIVNDILSFLGEFCRGEIQEQTYSPAAYNADRLVSLRHSRVPAMLTTVLHTFPPEGSLITNVTSILLLLLNYQEQCVDIGEAKVFKALLSARNRCTDPEDQNRLLRVISMVKDRCVVG